MKENEIPVEDVRICYSPFSRTIHTAKVVASALNIPFEGSQCKACHFISIPLENKNNMFNHCAWCFKKVILILLYFDGQVIEELRERYFGPSFELKSHDKVSK